MVQQILVILFICILSNHVYSIPNIKRVAHAGGGYNGITYTNSLEALDYNLAKGFTFFEIDFSWTKDENLVCIHDWNKSFEKIFNFTITERPSLEIFKFLVKHASPYKLCTFNDLKIWLQKNPEVKIITDIKKHNLKALQLIAEQGLQDNIIPQCYFPENYDKIRKLGYKNIIWTLYRYQGSNQDVLKVVTKLDDIFAITIPTKRAKAGLAKKLMGIPSYVHTINNAAQLDEYINKYGITEIYTDFLEPTINH